MKNHTDVLIFHNPLEVDLAICFWTKANSPDGRRENAFADFSPPLRNKRRTDAFSSEMGISVKKSC